LGLYIHTKSSRKPFLRELHLINVMSHKNSVFRFANGINVLVGRRGSGKTTVIEALRLLFGGIGRERQAQLKNFVRYGAEEAIIRAIFSNSIYIPGRGLIRLIPELPDDVEITIERVIKCDGKSEFRLNGKTVRKSDIEKIFLRVNISPQNMLYFLPQERVNEWVSLSAKKRIDLLLSALGLYEVKEHLRRLNEKIKEKRKLKEKLKLDLTKLKKKLIEYEKELSLGVALKEKLYKYYIFKIAKIKKEIGDLTERLMKIEDEERELRARYNAFIEELEQKEKERKDIDLQFSKLEQKLLEIKNNRVRCDARLKELEKRIDALQSQLIELKIQMDEIRKKLEHIKEKWNVKSEEDLNRLIEEKKKERKQLQEALFENSEYRKIYQLEQEKKRLKTEEENLKREKQLLLKNLQDTLRIIDASGKLYELVLKLEELAYKDLHLANVYGPVALFSYVNLPSDELKEWALAIDKAIDDEVKRTFIALLPESREKFLRLAMKTKAKNVNIVTLVYKDREYIDLMTVLRIIDRLVDDYRNRRERLKEKAREIFGADFQRFIIGWVCDLITAPNPIKALIEMHCWDVPITTDEEYALRILKELPVRKVVTIHGQAFIRKSTATPDVYSIQVSTQNVYEPESTIIFRVSAYSLYRFRETLESIENNIRDIRNQIRKLGQQIKAFRAKLPARILELEERLNKIEKQLRELYEVKHPFRKLLERTTKLPIEEQKVRELLTNLQEEYEKIIAEKARLDDEERIIEIKMKELEKRKEEVLERIGELKMRLEELKKKLEEIPPQIKFIKKIIDEKTNQISQIKKRVFALIELLKRYGEYPQGKNTEEIFYEEVEKKAETISKELPIEQIEAELAVLEKHLEDYTKALYNLESKLEEITELKKRIDEKEKELRKAEEELEKIEELSRKEIRQLVNEILRKLSRANEYYKRLLETINARGFIAIRGSSLENLSLHITINLHREKPEDIDSGGFSSGEKTTAIMAFILAMFLASPAPIYMFDEFDVFLDDRSLQEVLIMLRSALKDFQGLITTTHREEIIASADKVFYLEYDENELCTKVYEIET